MSQIKLYVYAKFIVGAATISALSACSSGTSSSDAAVPLNVSGTIAVAAASQKVGVIREESLSSLAVDLTQLNVVCSTTSTPVQTGSAKIGADGKFKVSILGAAGQPMACSMVDNAGIKKADFLISDASKHDMNGNPAVTTSAAFKNDAALGSINYDSTAGEVTVPAANVASVVAAAPTSAASVFDPTGTWTIGNVDFPLPAGNLGPCAGGQCNGPPAGQTIYLKLWNGLLVADNSTPVYGLQVWDSPTAFNSCGSKIGLTTTAKSNIGVSFAAQGAADAVFTYASSVASFADPISSVTGPVNITGAYKMDTAKTTYNLQPGCSSINITLGGVAYSNAWICGSDTVSNVAPVSQVQLGGGCVVNATNRPVRVDNWAGFTCPSPVLDGSTNIRTQTCTGSPTLSGVVTPVTCTNTFAVVNSTSKVALATETFNYANLPTQIASGTLCSAIGGNALLQNQCYANYYSQSRIEKSGACLPRVNFDWTAGVANVDLNRPGGLVFFDQYNPSPDGNGGSLTTRQDHYEGVQVKDNWVNCHVVETSSLSVKKINAGKLLATYQSSRITTNLTKPACLGAFTGARQTYLFYLTK